LIALLVFNNNFSYIVATSFIGGQSTGLLLYIGHFMLKPSIKGISLSITQWSYLLSIRQHITRAMYQASNAE
jgi:hypothetical protein